MSHLSRLVFWKCLVSFLVLRLAEHTCFACCTPCVELSIFCLKLGNDRLIPLPSLFIFHSSSNHLMLFCLELLTTPLNRRKANTSLRITSNCHKYCCKSVSSVNFSCKKGTLFSVSERRLSIENTEISSRNFVHN